MTTNSEVTPRIPTVGTPAYWRAQREAFALVVQWQETQAYGDLDAERATLAAITDHGFASRIMAAHGRPVARWLDALNREIASYEAARWDDEVVDPDEPPSGHDWCPRGCQPLHRLGECGMCGFQGRGVPIDKTASVAEYCCHCNARTYQSHDGICELCGKDAEDSCAVANRDKGLDACLASAEHWRQEAANLRVLAGGTHLTSEQGATLLREAEAADRQAEWWITGDDRPAPSMKETRP